MNDFEECNNKTYIDESTWSFMSMLAVVWSSDLSDPFFSFWPFEKYKIYNHQKQNKNRILELIQQRLSQHDVWHLT